MKKILSLFLALGLIVGLSACESGDEAADTKNDEKQEEEKEDKELTIGDTAEVDGIKITINSVRIDDGSEYLKPDEGKIWFIMDVSLENTGDDSFSSSSLMCYTLKDADGREQDIAIGPDLNGSLDTEVPAGEKSVGEIAFSTASEGELYLTFTPGFGDSAKIKVR